MYFKCILNILTRNARSARKKTFFFIKECESTEKAV